MSKLGPTIAMTAALVAGAALSIERHCDKPDRRGQAGYAGARLQRLGYQRADDQPW
jgi:hypothetical protein